MRSTPISTACITGWGQPIDALKSIAPEDAIHVDFARHNSANAALLEISNCAKECELVIGWSLGGQLALRAIATGMLRPRKLVLLAAPFQFVRKEHPPIGMPKDTFAQFLENYEKNPKATLKKAWGLIAMDDSNEQHVREYLNAHDKDQLIHYPWLAWLHILESYSCHNLYLEEAPETLILHGNKDLVVYPEQSDHIKALLPHATLKTLEGCGHAPHWHDSKQVRTLIEEFIHV